MNARWMLSAALGTGVKLLPSGVKAGLLRQLMRWSPSDVLFNNFQYTVEGSIQNLRASGYKPSLIVDVGANIGDWAKMARSIFPDVPVHLIEAQPKLEPMLKKICEVNQDLSYTICLAGAQTGGEERFFLDGTGSSVFEEDTNRAREKVTLPIVCLDDVVDLKGVTTGVFLKLDVQGYELEVLKGGGAAS